MSLIEKIDAEIARLHEEQRSMRSGVDAERVWLKIDEAEIIKRIILSEQKEPRTMGDKIRESNESLSAFIRGQFGDDRIFHDENQIDLDEFLNQPSTK